jgi:N utilization substance protein A
MNRELLMLVEAISREKSVERDVVFWALWKQRWRRLPRSCIPGDVDIRVALDRDKRQLRNLPPLACGPR